MTSHEHSVKCIQLDRSSLTFRCKVLREKVEKHHVRPFVERLLDDRKNESTQTQTQ